MTGVLGCAGPCCEPGLAPRGHEFAETETGIIPNGGWRDKNGAENADKCARVSRGPGASASVSLNGKAFPVQSLWSNASNGGSCVSGF